MGDIDQHDVHAGKFEGKGLWHDGHNNGMFEKSLVVSLVASSCRLRTNIFIHDVGVNPFLSVRRLVIAYAHEIHVYVLVFHLQYY